MASVPDPHDLVLADARAAVERVIWQYGITGDRCAVVAARIITSLTEAGFVISTANGSR